MKAISNSPRPREKALRNWNGLMNMPGNVGCVNFGSGGIVLTAATRTQSLVVKFARALALSAIFICLTSCEALGQVQAPVQAHVKISVSNPNEIVVQAVSSTSLRSWSFRNAAAGVLGIAERIEQFRGAGTRKVATGEFRSDAGAKEIEYVVRLTRPSAASVAHVTWLGDDYGFLMFADLLPQEFAKVSAEFALPSGWAVYSSGHSSGHSSGNSASVSEPADAVFFVGRSVRKLAQKQLDCFVSGSWPFKDSVAMKAAARVVEKYLALTGYSLPAKPVVMIAPLPVSTGVMKWRAETRGSTVLLLLDPEARISNWKGQFEIIFTHEALHLWVPNALHLSGDYDWFFEGFTLYTALVTALELKAINFKEYLDTLARVYDSYLSYADDVSLIDASERRWTSGTSVVYDKGMLVAFLFDLVVRKESGGKTRLVDRYRELFGRLPAEQADGNDVIIKLLSSTPATAELARSYILGRRQLEFEKVLASYGFLLDTSGQSSRLSISKQVDEGQKRLLRSLGYQD